MAKRLRRLSRLARKEETRSFRQALFFGILSVILLLLLIFLGIPALIRMAIFLGEIRTSSVPIKTEDTLPPAPPSLTPLPHATNEDKVNLRGFAEPESTVEVFLNNISERKLVVESNGSFIASEIVLTSGRNEITAEATDNAGNTSQKSGKIIIFYDTTPPELTISEPADQSSFSGRQNQIKIIGKTEEDSTVTVNDHFIILKSEGNFEFVFTLSDGENLIKIVATDQAGNKTEKELTVNYSS